MDKVEQVFFNVPLNRLAPIFKSWVKEALIEMQGYKAETIKQPEKLLTVKEAATFLNLTVPTIYSKVSRGELPCMKRGKRLYFSSKELMDYIKKGRKKTNKELEQEAQAYLSKTKKG